MAGSASQDCEDGTKGRIQGGADWRSGAAAAPGRACGLDNVSLHVGRCRSEDDSFKSAASHGIGEYAPPIND